MKTPADQILARDRELCARVVDVVARCYGLSPLDLYGRSRQRWPSLARQAAWHALHTEHGMPYATIGALFDRDHSSCLYGVQQEASRRIGRVFELEEV